jgi:hypothetical protein
MAAQSFRAQEARRLLVLVPHAEIRRRLYQFSAELFEAGLAGAWSFPHVAPLAALSQALNPPELKQCAALLRRHNAMNDYKITSRVPARAAFPGELGMDIYGPELDCVIPDSFKAAASNKSLYWFSPIVFGTAIVGGYADTGGFNEMAGRIRPPELGFRAAGLANMVYTPLPDVHAGGYSWKIERLYWLPQPAGGNAGLQER